MTISRLALCASAVTLGVAVAAPSASASIVNLVGGRDDVWPTAVRQSLTYCVSDRFGPFDHRAVTMALDRATAEWEAAAGGGIDYVHVVQEDLDCTRRNGNVVFSVEPTNRKVVDETFYPSTPRRHRRILLNLDLLLDGEHPLVGVIRHELGHTLGLRHEHIRPESGTCLEDDAWRALTPYDPASVMHYPQCSGGGGRFISELDAEGVASLY